MKQEKEKEKKKKRKYEDNILRTYLPGKWKPCVHVGHGSSCPHILARLCPHIKSANSNMSVETSRGKPRRESSDGASDGKNPDV